MRKISILCTILIAVATLIIGFAFGFHRGETFYIWAFAGIAEIFWTALVGIGTLLVAIVAVWQTKKANEMNRQLLNLELKSKVGYFKMVAVPAPNEIKFCNVGDDSIKITKTLFYSEAFEEHPLEYQIDNSKILIFPNDTRNIIFQSNRSKASLSKQLRLTIVLFMENMRGYEYKQVIYINKLKESAETTFDSKILEIHEPHDNTAEYYSFVEKRPEVHRQIVEYIKKQGRRKNGK